MITILTLSATFQGIAAESLLDNNSTPEAKESFKTKNRAIDKQLDLLIEHLINKNPIGQITINVPSFPPPTTESNNAKYLTLKELLTSLEEDAFHIIDGDTSTTRKDSLLNNIKNFRAAKKDLLISLGLLKSPTP